MVGCTVVLADSAALGKPLIIEEFGAEQNRDAYFKAAFDEVETSLKSGGPLKGALFWQYYAPGQVRRVAGQTGIRHEHLLLHIAALEARGAETQCAERCRTDATCAAWSVDRQQGRGRRGRPVWHLQHRLHFWPDQEQRCGVTAAVQRPRCRVQREGPRGRWLLRRQRVRGRGE